MAGVGLHGAGKAADGSVQFAGLTQGAAEIIVRLGIIRPDRDDGPKLPDRSVELTIAEQGIAEIVHSFRIVGSKAQCLSEMSNRLAILALMKADISQ